MNILDQDGLIMQKVYGQVTEIQKLMNYYQMSLSWDQQTLDVDP